jgi:hypothetical protein
VFEMGKLLKRDSEEQPGLPGGHFNTEFKKTHPTLISSPNPVLKLSVKVCVSHPSIIKAY